MATTSTRADGADPLVWLGRAALALLAADIGIAIALVLRDPKPPSGTYCENEGSAGPPSCISVSTPTADDPPKTVARVSWSRSSTRPQRLVLRRAGRTARGAPRYDLYAVDVDGRPSASAIASSPLGSLEDEGRWVILALAVEPAERHAMRSDTPTWSSWAE